LPLLTLLGALLSAIAATIGWLQLAEHQRMELAWVSQDHNQALRKGIEDALDVVHTLAELLAVDPDIEQTDFASFAASLRDRHPGIVRLEWQPEMDAGSAEHRPGPDRAPDPFAPRDGEPRLTQVPKAVDLVPEQGPVLADLIQRALASHEPTASARIPLDRAKARYGVLVVVPVAPGPTPARGVVVGLLALDDLVAAAVRLLEPRGLEMLVQDLSAPPENDFLAFYASRLGPAPRLVNGTWQGWSMADAARHSDVIQVADRRWSITCSPTPHYRSAEGFRQGPWILLGGGLGLTLLVALFVRSLRDQVRVRLDAEQALRSSEQKLRILFSQSPDIMMTVNRLGRIITVNRPWPKAPHESAVGHNSAKILPKGLRKWYRNALAEVVASGAAQHFEYSQTDSKYWEVRIVPLRSGPSVDAAMVIATDVTERRLLEAQAIRSARLATLGVLAASVAHEINNPNNAIQFNAAVLQRSIDDALPILRRESAEHGSFLIGGIPVAQAIDALPRMLAGLQRNAQRIQNIVGTLKQMARHDPGEYDDAVDLRRVLQSAYSILQHQVQQHTDHCELLLPETLPKVRGNSQQLEQVFINLLLNALQALPNRRARVWIAAECAAGQVRVAVVDQGNGIADDLLAKIFDPFFTTRVDQGGTGLGLSICRRIIQNHGGTIGISSVLGVGTEVLVRLAILGARSTASTDRTASALQVP
jgi:PAS domain S-box-containing protein